MGGADAILAKAREAFDAGEYRWVAQVLEHLVYAQPDNKDARNPQADAFEQLAYQAEAATWRNFYTVGAKELRDGVPDIKIGVGASPDLIKNTPLSMVLDYLGIAIDSEKAAGKALTINLEVEGTDEKHTLTLKNRVLNATAKPAANPDLTLKGEGAALNALLMGGDPEAVLKSGTVAATGRTEAVSELLALVTNFEFWFPIITRPSIG